MPPVDGAYDGYYDDEMEDLEEEALGMAIEEVKRSFQIYHVPSTDTYRCHRCTKNPGPSLVQTTDGNPGQLMGKLCVSGKSSC
jgi:hypothetical protein